MEAIERFFSTPGKLVTFYFYTFSSRFLHFPRNIESQARSDRWIAGSSVQSSRTFLVPRSASHAPSVLHALISFVCRALA